MNNNFFELVEKAGGTRQFVREIGLLTSAIRNWKHEGRVPAKHHPRVLELAEQHGISLTEQDLMDLY